MKSNNSWRIRLAQILLGAGIVIALVVVLGTNAGNKPVHLTTDWSHRHLVFSPPHNLAHHVRLLSNPRYVQQLVRRNAERRAGMEDRDRDDRRWRRAPENSNPLHGDWSMYMGYNGDPTANPLVVGTAGAGNYPAKF